MARPPSKEGVRCRHCKKNKSATNTKGVTTKRGLCAYCYDILSIRNRYPKRKSGRPILNQFVREPSMKRLDAAIAKRMKKLPPWWSNEDEPEWPREPYVPRLRAQVRISSRER